MGSMYRCCTFAVGGLWFRVRALSWFSWIGFACGDFLALFLVPAQVGETASTRDVHPLTLVFALPGSLGLRLFIYILIMFSTLVSGVRPAHK